MIAVAAAVFQSVALDNTQKNDFWDTTAYGNAVPVVQENEPDDDLSIEDVVPAYVTVSAFDSFGYSLAISNVLNLFNSNPPKGMTVIFR